jgi:hypothetical protein
MLVIATLATTGPRPAPFGRTSIAPRAAGMREPDDEGGAAGGANPSMRIARTISAAARTISAAARTISAAARTNPSPCVRLVRAEGFEPPTPAV